MSRAALVVPLIGLLLGGTAWAENESDATTTGRMPLSTSVSSPAGCSATSRSSPPD
jgi:hypothetical protein